MNMERNRTLEDMKIKFSTRQIAVFTLLRTWPPGGNAAIKDKVRSNLFAEFCQHKSLRARAWYEKVSETYHAALITDKEVISYL